MSKAVSNIAMWSGPRNLSTAMMYSFAQRSDTRVVDEPFYAAYLSKTGIQHAMYQEIIDDGETNPSNVISRCTELLTDNKPILYQKHMTKHMIEGIDRSWIDQVTNVFLIRDPRRVIASYHAKQEQPDLSDIGVKEQVELFDRVCQKTGNTPTVIDSADILLQPKEMLLKLCQAIGIEFQASMLEWQAGPKSYDGIWAPHWYKSVWQSTGFSGSVRKPPDLPKELRKLADKAEQYYQELICHKIKVE
jgi:hypothetical protein